ncbi:hypothetical protein BIY29_06335 [Brenneria alni]|uniref:Uncharacterized protein n=1 Tax=Brenneria alni TaxID=71656 RepID=A0A421DQU5_9GAMM|nr:hypothetical protein BIY29_06335 [Brenneria alni]
MILAQTQEESEPIWAVVSWVFRGVDGDDHAYRNGNAGHGGVFRQASQSARIRPLEVGCSETPD